LHDFAGSHNQELTMTEKNQGEGNRDADRRYRKGVQETVQETTEEEREQNARDISDDELEEAREAEERGRGRARQ
jgi:hypothetical protein